MNKRVRQGHVKPKKPGDNVPCIYSGETAILLATGPSLSEEQIECIRPYHESGQVRVFGLNDSYKICDFLDVLYFCDPGWLKHNPDVLDYSCSQIWTQDVRVPQEHPHVNRVAGSSGKGLCIKPHFIHFGGNSGFQLINLALHFGIERFVLLGYNMQVPKGMQQHFFGKHPKGLNQNDSYKGFTSSFDQIQPALRSKIINCTPNTALKCFDIKPLNNILENFNEQRRGGERGGEISQEASEESTASQTDRADLYGLYGGASGHRSESDKGSAG